MVAVAVFTVISSAAFMLFNQQQNTSIVLNGQVGLNMGLRNTASMLQADLADAGSNYFQDVNMSYGVLGVTILNNVVQTPVSGTTSCHTSGTTIYGNSCFDQLSILQVDNTYVLYPTNSAGTCVSSSCINTNNGTAYAIPASGSGLSLATIASYYHTGDQLIFVRQNGSLYTSVILTSNATASATAVLFTFNPTTTSNGVSGVNSLANDPINISACGGAATCPVSYAGGTTPPLTNQFGSSDYILKLQPPITYLVCSGPGSPTTPWACDQTANSPDIADPKLMRVSGSIPSLATANVVMEQVIGFKVGGTVWNSSGIFGSGTADFDNANYLYDASAYYGQVANDSAYNFTVLRSVRVSLIGRTAPATTKNYVYRNGFDGGAYQVQGTALVVNPRNMNFTSGTSN
jgi:hypothetical protein